MSPPSYRDGRPKLWSITNTDKTLKLNMFSSENDFGKLIKCARRQDPDKLSNDGDNTTANRYATNHLGHVSTQALIHKLLSFLHSTLLTL